MVPSIPVIHESPFPGYPKATEYFLPQPDIPVDVRGNLSPWLLGMVMSPTLGHGVDERIAESKHHAIQSLRAQLRSYRPTSLVAREDKQAWLRLASGHTSENIGASAFLPALPDKERVRAQLESTGFSSNEVFSAFAIRFCGLAEDYASAGNFLEDAEDWSLLSKDWQEETIGNYDEWAGALLFYHARNGDQLLLHTDGHVGWWKYAEGRVTRECDSFTDSGGLRDIRQDGIDGDLQCVCDVSRCHVC